MFKKKKVLFHVQLNELSPRCVCTVCECIRNGSVCLFAAFHDSAELNAYIYSIVLAYCMFCYNLWASAQKNKQRNACLHCMTLYSSRYLSK